jgi:hypothetical protein
MEKNMTSKMIKAKNYLLMLLGFILLSQTACKDDDMQPEPNPTIREAEGVFILNEGTFNFGNASVSYYHFENDEVTEKLFENANGQTPGDVLQDMYIIDDKAYLVLNNSGFIQVVDLESFESLGLIQPFDSPRYFLPIDAFKAYVSDLYSNSVQVVDLGDLEVIDKIEVPFWSDEMVKVGQKVFVSAPWDVRVDAHDHIYVLNPLLDILQDSIQVGIDPAAIALDAEDNLWVYCRGAEGLGEPAGLFCIDTQTETVIRSLIFDDHNLGFAARLAFNPAGDTLYYLKNDVFAFALEDLSLPESPIIMANDRSLYALGVHPVNGAILVGDARDYAQNGEVLLYNAQGELKRSIDAGVIPARFVFY